MKRYRIAENHWNLEGQPWRDAIGIEEIDPDDNLAVPTLVCWFTRGEGQAELAARIIKLLNMTS
jgi:hypothetical protein